MEIEETEEIEETVACRCSLCDTVGTIKPEELTPDTMPMICKRCAGELPVYTETPAGRARELVRKAFASFGPRLTLEQIKAYTGLSRGDAIDALANLENKGSVSSQGIRSYQVFG